MSGATAARTAAPASARIPGLDGWRAICALWVVVAHILEYSNVRIANPGSHVDMGPLGVEFFFGISGFVIGRGLVAEGRPNLGAFYVRRFFRILPPLTIFLAALTILALFGVIEWRALGAWRALTFTCDLPGAECGGWYGAHLWSLSAEEQFYLVAPLLIALIPTRATLTAIVLLPGPLTVAAYALGLTAVSYVAGHFVAIGLGVAAALNEERVRGWVARIPWPFAVVALVVVICAWAIPHDKTLLWGVPRSRLANVLQIFLVDPLILCILLVTSLKDSPIGRFLRAPPLQAIGAASYSLYLWQQLATGPTPGAGVAFYLISSVMCVALALALFRWVEAPLIAWGGRLSRRFFGGPSPAGARAVLRPEEGH